MKIYNKGIRQYTFENEKGETEIIASQKIKDVPQKEADRLLKGYPRELINAKDFDDSKQTKIDKISFDKIKQSNETLAKENAILKERIKQLENEEDDEGEDADEENDKGKNKK